jgi:hypothetical protein
LFHAIARLRVVAVSTTISTAPCVPLPQSD